MRSLLAASLTPEANAKKSNPGSKNGKWLPVGSRRTTHNLGYVEIKIAEPNVWAYEHRVVAGAPDGMHVHHLDGNVTNNDPANLSTLTHSEHSKLHMKRVVRQPNGRIVCYSSEI
jgi:hypothetical protein